MDTELREEGNNTNITQNDNTSKTSKVVKEGKEIANKSVERTNDSIKDVLAKGDLDKTEDYVEDQIAEASEYDKTHVEYNKDELKNKERVSLINYSEELMLNDSKILTNKKILTHDNNVKEILSNSNKVFNISKEISLEVRIGQNNMTEPIQDKGNGQERDALKNKEYKTTEKQETAALTLFDADFASLEEETEDTIVEIGNKQTDKRESGITVLNYKDPCEPNKGANEITTENIQTIYEVTEILPEVNEAKYDKVDKPTQINIFNVLGTTYRISQVISTLKQNKKSVKDKIKNLFRNEKTETTTPTFIPNLFLNKDGRSSKNRVVKRQKRFLPFFRRSEGDSNNILFRMLDFLIKNRKNVLPVFTVMREINTLVKSGNGELNHISKEQNNYIGASPPVFAPITYNLELGNENRAVAFMKRILGLSPSGDRLTINGRK